MHQVCHKPLEEQDAKLIEAVKATESLYNPKHVDFRSSSHKNQDWEKIGNLIDSNARHARQRWTVLRERYSRDLKLFRENPNKCAVIHDALFQKMDFLRAFVKNRRKRELKNARRSIKLPTANRQIKPLIKTQANDCGNQEGFPEVYIRSRKDLKSKFEANYPVTTAKALAPKSFTNSDAVVGHNNQAYDEYTTDNSSTNSATSDHNKKTTISSLPGNVAPADTRLNKSRPNDILQPCSDPNPSLEPADIRVPKQESQQRDDNAEEDELFSKSIAAHLKLLTRRSKIKAKVEMYQVLEKYIIRDESS